MKKHPMIFLLIALSGMLYTAFITADPVLELSEAIKQKKVTVDISSNGGFSGKCVSLKIKNLTSRDLKVLVKPGTTFVPEEDDEQTLLVPKSQLVAIGKLQTHEVGVSAYCTESSDKCPSEESKFTLSTNTNPKLNELIKRVAAMGNVDDIIQASIWCITDGHSVSHVYSDNTELAKSMRAFLCTTTGQKDTWYTTRQVAQVNEERRILSNPVEVKGKIEMNNTRPVQLTGVVVDESGTEKLRYPNPISLPAGKIQFDFKLKVSGWTKGNYAVIYSKDGKEVLKQNFSI